jgi:hypothetical protein
MQTPHPPIAFVQGDLLLDPFPMQFGPMRREPPKSPKDMSRKQGLPIWLVAEPWRVEVDVIEPSWRTHIANLLHYTWHHTTTYEDARPPLPVVGAGREYPYASLPMFRTDSSSREQKSSTKLTPSVLIIQSFLSSRTLQTQRSNDKLEILCPCSGQSLVILLGIILDDSRIRGGNGTYGYGYG